ncbi:BatA domain-containing protein [bacterium SCSIO 12643]|nr:BatA domain-containing protein [bacterium SCSIO 12643]
MSFLYPQFLLALIAVLIPVIIHLFNFQRYKKVYFSNVAFLKEVKHSTKAKSNLKHLLILLSRMLAITAVVLVFAQPFIPVSDQNSNSQKVSSTIYIDNSFSTENKNAEGRVFDVAREIGYQLVDQLPQHVNHQLLSNNFTGAEQHLYPTTELTKKLQELEINNKTQLLDHIVKRQASAFSESAYNSFIISDFHKSQFDFSSVPTDTLINYTLIPIQPILSQNISVDSVWFENPVHRTNTPEEIHFRLTNHSSKNIEGVRTTLFIDSTQRSFGNFDIPAKSQIDTFLVFNSKITGWHKGMIQINDRPIIFDNAFYFSYNVLDKIKVLSISSDQSSDNIKTAFLTEPYFEFHESHQSKLDFNSIMLQDLVILNEINHFSSGMIASIQQFVKNGGHLIVVPSSDQNQIELNTLLTSLKGSVITGIDNDSTRVNFINLNHHIYQDVFTHNQEKINLPDVYQHFTLSSNSQQDVLLKTVNQHPILSTWKAEKGQVFLFSLPLNASFSNFRIHSIFLPTFFQIAFNSSPQFNLYQTIGEDQYVTIKQPETHNDILYHIVDQNLDIIPEKYPTNNGVQLIFHDAIKQAGNYTLQTPDSIVGLLSFNYSRIESNPDCYSNSDLESIIDSLNLTNFSVFDSSIENFSDEFEKRETGIELWRWFILLALLFLAIEIILIRYFKPSVL